MKFKHLSHVLFASLIFLTPSCAEPNKNKNNNDSNVSSQGVSATVQSWVQGAAKGLLETAMGNIHGKFVEIILPPDAVDLSEESYKRIEQIVQKQVAKAFFEEVRADLNGLQIIEMKGYARSASDPKRSLAIVGGYCESLAKIIPRLKNHGSYGVSSLIQAAHIYASFSQERIVLLKMLKEADEVKSRSAAFKNTMGDIAGFLQNELNAANTLYDQQLKDFKVPQLNPRTGTRGGTACLDIPGKPCFYSPLANNHLELATAEVQKRRKELKDAMGGEKALQDAIKGSKAWQAKNF